MARFCIGDKVRRVSPDNDHKFWNEPDDNLFHGNVYTVKECKYEDIRLEQCRQLYSSKYFELVEPSQQQPTLQPELYTQSELSYIAELEDRVELLEELCNDYAKIIAEKDYMIKMLQGMA